MTEQVTVWTIGHGASSIEALIDCLRVYDVQTVVDVRTVPYSQYHPQFSRERFSARLLAEGIAYRQDGKNLGGRPSNPDCYRRRQIPAGDVDYLQVVDYDEIAARTWFVEALERLVASASHGGVAVLCAEEDPRRCHRHHLIARQLLRRGVRVMHIRHPAGVRCAVEDARFVWTEVASSDCEQQLRLLERVEREYRP